MRKRFIILLCTVLMLALTITLPGQPINSVLAEGTAALNHSPTECEAFVQNLVDQMTDKEKVGQLFIPGATNPRSEPTETERRRIQEFGYGGFIFSGLKDPRQAANYVNQLQEWAEDTRLGIPVFAASDMEWGASHQFIEIGPEEGKPTPVPFPMGLGATRNVEHAETAARITATEARAMGFTMNFAPVADVNTNPNNPVIGVRSFGEQPGLASDMVAAQVSAFQENGVMAAAKHFPGHGDTAVDSHTGLPIVTYDRETLEDVHLAPFQAAIDAGVDSIMTAHVIIEAIDPDLPATLSPKILTDLLREEMGYNGVIITDSMGMAAIRDKWGTKQAAVMAIKAGADLILSVSHESYEGILEALRSGDLSEERINESVKRVLKLKCKYGLFNDPYVDPEAAIQSVGTADNIQDTAEISRDTITLVKNNGVLPLNPKQRDKTILVTGQTSGAFRNVLPPLADTVRKMTDSTVIDMGWPVQRNPRDVDIEEVVREAKNVDTVIVATYSSGTLSEQQIKLVNGLVETGTPVVVISLGLPYDLENFPEVGAYLASYALNVNPMASIQSVKAAVEVVFGEQPGGKLPVTIGDLYTYGHGLQYESVKNIPDIKVLVEQFEEEGEFDSERVVRALKTHLTAVERYEKQKIAEKVVKHMESFKLLLDHQLENELISERAYRALKVNADFLVKKYSEELSLGNGDLPETRESIELTTGVTHTEIMRGYESDKAFYTVEMGFFEERSDAQELRKQLIDSGFKAKVHPIRDRNFRNTDVGEQIIGYLVQVGEFSSQREANFKAEEISNSGFSTSRVAYSEYDGTRKSTGPWHIHVLEVDPEQFTGSLQTGIAHDQIEGNDQLSSMAARQHALAAINGGYFVISSTDGTPGDLAGISVLDGKLISESVGERTSFILEGNEASIAETRTMLSMELENGKSCIVDGINRVPGLIRSCGGNDDFPTDLPMHDITCTDDDEIIQFNASFGDKTPSGEGYEIVLDEQGFVTRVMEERGSDIPEFGHVLSATGDAANWLRENTAVGQKVILRNDLLVDGKKTSTHSEMNIVNGAPRLLKNGKQTIPADKEGFHWSSEFYYNFALYRHPRTLVGIKENGNIIFVTVDGRNPGSSIGTSFHESAELLKDLGAVEGMNLDGGGSTTMVINHEVVNTPSGSTERAIADGVFIIE